MSARVLIAEDEPAIALSLEFLMKSNGHETRIAGDGEEALRLAAAFQPDLIVLDLMLPKLSGIEVCLALRNGAQPCRAKVLMLTARGAESDLEQGLAAGVDAYQIKPFSTQELMTQVRRLLAMDGAPHAN